MSDLLKNREVIFEFYTIGAAVKVSAVDVKSMVEATIQGPKNTPESVLQREALKKLDYVLRKKGIIT